MYANFDADHTVKLLEAAGGDFSRLRAAAEYIKKNRFVLVIKPEHVREALEALEKADQSKAAAA